MMPGPGLGPQQPGRRGLETDPLELPWEALGSADPQVGLSLWLRGLICVGTHSGLPPCGVLAWSPRESQWKNKRALNVAQLQCVCVCGSGALGQHVGRVPVTSISLALGGPAPSV